MDNKRSISLAVWLVVGTLVTRFLLPTESLSAVKKQHPAGRPPISTRITSGQIAFVSDRAGNLEIYTMNTDGTNLTRLTTNSAKDEGPNWSPDGSRMVFHSDRDGHNQIYVMDANGSHQERLLTSTTSDEWAFWSPNGDKIAFCRVADHQGDGHFTAEVFVMNPNGTDVNRLTHSFEQTGGHQDGAWPSGWSPDGSQIVFYWYREGYDQLWIMNSDGSNQRRLTADTSWNAIPTMSPDGTRMAFSSYRDGNWEVYAMNSNGTGTVRLTNAPDDDWRPVWSQDGSKIVFESRRDGLTQVYWMNTDGSQQMRLTSGMAYDGQAVWQPASPDQHYKVFLPLLKRPVCAAASDSPSWKILVLAYETTDFLYTDDLGQQHHFYSTMTETDKERISSVATRFGREDVPALNSCNMQPAVVVRYLSEPLTSLTALGCNDYVPSPSDAAPDRDPSFDSVIAVWDGSGTDLMTGDPWSIQGCAWAWGMGTGQTYDAIPADYVQYSQRNIFKHEWGHSIIFYYDAAGTAPKPAVNNHINDTDTQYVNCKTGQSYILQDETDYNPIPNSIYNNQSGFTHDYYSGQTATIDQPTRCLGITPSAWASGGPVSRPSNAESRRWFSPSDDVITSVIPYHPCILGSACTFPLNSGLGQLLILRK